ncbi:MAG: Methionyl-tRNA formyltransferase [Candidatus Woesebacteria bacterium GW2011_GWB1_43_14]|uniref:methionyl-tRNA formyltransferase n=1 Tax=Candidatus Woesebacteria bacterium GW2011_GWB1_43_14 TaxID=1618578 RepID=A0A0G1GDH9_9BACT|nr:MAG: Methionyl-tRNA formyltransferase [Candidatus Woesebacteria bacterium GW2011_GWA1_39_11b]KKS77754.1 MAG: methionyl-tRNA formyltransferase, methionyl-tRNA formyltransferase [Candidatus Woesebacteria bacterium GW2011_GWC1_42_9]KKS96938.1 MAG: Methionyl-tRNA formyltransferase [Candidatus Woesebacteria bacterium GW2011_GWB1_43_14]
MKIIFFGTPDYVLPIVKNIPDLTALVTKKLTESSLERWAKKNKIKIIYDLENIPKADLGIVAAYGKIIPDKVINNCKFGIINIHPSLLPKYRGASPVQEAIKNGDEATGVTFIKMDKEIDHGPIIASFKEKILNTDTTDSLRKRLFKKASKFIIDLIPNYVNKKIKLTPQNHKLGNYTPPLTKKDGFIDLNKTTPVEAGRFIRAMNPWPISWTLLRLKATEGQTYRLKILSAHISENKKLILDEVQLEGKKPVTWKQFKEGYPDFSFSS